MFLDIEFFHTPTVLDVLQTVGDDEQFIIKNKEGISNSKLLKLFIFNQLGLLLPTPTTLHSPNSFFSVFKIIS